MYDNPKTVNHTTAAITTTAAAATLAIQGPAGKRGRIVDIIARCSTSHVLGSSTPTKLLVGKTGDTDAYATYTPPAMTAPTTDAFEDGAGTSARGVEDFIEADTTVLLTTVANAGGSPAGVIQYDVIIDWF